MTHLENLKQHISDLFDRKVLDIGSGKGNFLIELAKEKIPSCGIEMNKEYISIAEKEAHKIGLSIFVTQGVGEMLPYRDSEFGFINVSEVIEHVENPEKVIDEIYRVLQPEGMVYISVPARFSIRDPHFHMWFVNWLPRSLGDRFVLFFSRKTIVDGAGQQMLKDMHYYTYGAIKNIFQKSGFIVTDIREKKIKERFSKWLIRAPAVFIYKCIRPFYFDTFHFLLKK